MAGVQFDGLRAFRRELKKATGSLDDLKQANFDVANTVAQNAASKARGLGSTAAKAASTIKAGRAATKATVQLGGARAPYAVGSELGSLRYKQFKAWRGNPTPDVFGGTAGYFLYPSIRRNEDVIIEQYWESLEEIVRQAFP